MPSYIRVKAAPSQVKQALNDGLTADELRMLTIGQPKRDPFAPTAHRDIPELQTVVEFAALAIAGGVVHDGAKAALRKAIALLKARFGDDVDVDGDDRNDDANT